MAVRGDVRGGGCGPAKDVSLAVVAEIDAAGRTRKIKHSKMGFWRAVVLVLVHILIIAHVLQWFASGMSDGIRSTISPVEPSESMYTLETGQINAGFVMFVTALISTLLVGRFFCGWLCHVVALQDFCGWLMKKAGIHPKPWRVRLLLWAPLLLAVYMFVWPTVRREVLIERWLWNDRNADGLIQLGEYPLWLGEIIPLHGFTKDFIVEDFWKTFPAWYVAIPFLFICGFAIVYWLGAKAFCSYGCPYGGFFTPIDRYSPVRIRVNDDCNGCGHCTAVCTSNVRVHEEVRDYGAVVDPGCMKCMDCVSVCPNDALRVGVGLPAVLTKPRVEAAQVQKATAARQKRWDLTWPEEIVIALVFLAFVLGYRGIYNSVPLLMAMGIAGCGAFLVFKTWRMVRDRNVRGPFRQLKRDGRWTLAGWGVAGLTLAVVLLGVHGLVMNYHQWRAELIDGQITTARQVVFNPAGYTPRAEDKAMAQEALRHLAFTRPLGHRQDGAVGVALREQFVPNIRASWLSAVAGDFAGAEAALERAVLVREPDGQLLDGLMQFYALRKAPGAEVEGKLNMLMDRWDGVEPVRRALAGYYLQTGRGPMAVTLMEEGVKAKPRDIATINTAAELKAALGDLDGGVAVLRAGLEQRPASPVLKETLAALLLGQNKPEEALTWITKAAEQQSTLQRWQRAAELANALGQRDAAATAQRRAGEAELELADRALARMPRKEIFDRKAQVYRDLGREAEAKKIEAERDRVLARLKARSEASRKRHAE